MVGPGDKVSYRVSPMVGEGDSLKQDAANASAWTDVVEIGVTTKGGISCYFNRGIVASQWLSRLLPQADPGKALQTIIATKPSSFLSVSGLGVLPGARITRRVSAKPRQSLMYGARQARNALSTPGRTTRVVAILPT